MLRIIIILLLMFTLVACGAEGDTEFAATEAEVSEMVMTDEPVDEEVSEPAETAQAQAQSEALAVSDTESSEEIANYTYELTETDTLEMAWGGQATFKYPADWRVVSGDSEVTIYGDDRYTISLSVNNNPSNTASEARNLLDRLNQSAEIITIEQDGRELLHTRTLAGNAITGGLTINENIFAVTQMVNTRGRELDLMLPTMLDILASVEIVEDAE